VVGTGVGRRVPGSNGDKWTPCGEVDQEQIEAGGGGKGGWPSRWESAFFLTRCKTKLALRRRKGAFRTKDVDKRLSRKNHRGMG